jgi:hypothetical protein
MNLRALIAATILVSSQADAAETATACFGGKLTSSGDHVQSGIVGAFTIADARQALQGKTISVAYFSEAALKTGFNYESTEVEADPVVRAFTDTSVTESSGGETATYKITYEDSRWCRQGAVDGRKQCFVVVSQAGRGLYEASLETNDGQLCEVHLIARIAGLQLPANLLPAPPTRRRER